MAHNGVTYCKCDHCERLALRRMTAAREPEVEGPTLPGYSTPGEQELNQNQEEFFSGRTMVDLIAHLKLKYTPVVEQMKNHYQEIKDHVSDPHAKRRLREDCMRDLEANGEFAQRLFVKSVLYKLKREEIAKPGKLGRMIGDLGVAASLQGYRITEFMKRAQAELPIEYDGGIIEFVKAPEPEKLEQVFANLIAPPGKFYYVYFSDDACYSVRTSEGVKVYNMDISSCDTSQGRSVFETLVAMTPAPLEDDMRKLVEQCELPIRVQSSTDPRLVCLLRPDRPRLYSGSTITTIINNVANIAIAVSIRVNPNLSIKEAARKAGYIVTLDECTRPEEIQFLKSSPVRDTQGRYKPVLNLGVLLRLSGSCKGDLPGRGDLTKRAQRFQASLLNGYMTYASWPMLDALRKRFPLIGEAHKHDELQYKLNAGGDFSDEDILRRYDLDDIEKEDVRKFFNADLWETIGNSGLSKILMKDYGLQCNQVNNSLTYPHEVERNANSTTILT